MCGNIFIVSMGGLYGPFSGRFEEGSGDLKHAQSAAYADRYSKVLCQT